MILFCFLSHPLPSNVELGGKVGWSHTQLQVEPKRSLIMVFRQSFKFTLAFISGRADQYAKIIIM